MNPRVRPILLVEDNPMDLDLTCQAFREHSVANPLAICRDGEEALEYIEAHPHASDPQMPILVLLDLRLPKVDGIEVLLQRGRSSGLDQVPVVVMTSCEEERHVLASYHLGIHSYLAKPLNLDDVASTVSKIGIS